jgi:hypothetical protein
MSTDEATTRESTAVAQEARALGCPPLPLEAWLRSDASGTLELPAVRLPPAARGRGEIANFALCALVVVALGFFAGWWIRAGSSEPSNHTSTCLIICQK